MSLARNNAKVCCICCCRQNTLLSFISTGPSRPAVPASVNIFMSPASAKSAMEVSNVADATRAAVRPDSSPPATPSSPPATFHPGNSRSHSWRSAPVAASTLSQRAQQPLLHIIIERLMRQFCAWIDPGNHEHRMPLIDQPFDERIFRLEVQNIIFIDPRRNDQQRRREHGCRRRRILDELHQFILIDHLTRRRRDIFADAKGVIIRRANLQRAIRRAANHGSCYAGRGSGFRRLEVKSRPQHYPDWSAENYWAPARPKIAA